MCDPQYCASAGRIGTNRDVFLCQPISTTPKKKPDRREFWRGMYRSREDGTYGLEKFDRDGSGLISGLRQADGLIEIPEAVTGVRSGDLLNFIPWSEFGI